MTRLIDITPALSAQSPVFPGDTVFSAERSWSIADGSPVNVSRLTLSSHAGAHADAPLHYSADADAIDLVSLDAYIGPCRVLNMIDAGSVITWPDIERRLGENFPPRILLRTYAAQPLAWDPDFSAIDAVAITELASRGAKLIGVDTPSLDPADSKSMDAHQAVLRSDMRILEGLLLDCVDDGDYELIAPPLKLAGVDAAPVRAVLRTLS